MDILKVYLEIEKEACIPQRGSSGSAGLDIVAAEDKMILPGESQLISTGIKTAIPSGYEIQIRPRSGLSLRTSLRVANSPGTIDSDYRDEIKIICHNVFNYSDWKSSILFNPDLLKEIGQLKSVSYWEYLETNNIMECKQNENVYNNLIKILKKERIYLDENNYPYGTIQIEKGQRFAQMVFAKYLVPEFEIISDISEIGEDRGGGFGSTGDL